MKSYKSTKPLVGPIDVTPWHELTRASPCELDRKFGYVRTRHKNLAKAERLLIKVSALPVNQRHPDAIDNLNARANNHRAHLAFCCRTLEEHCKFAVARFDGSLDKLKPLAHGKKRGKTGGNGRTPKAAAKIKRLVNYYLNELPTYFACCAVSEGTSGQDDAMRLLMQTAAPVVAMIRKKSPRGPEMAEQLAWEALWQKASPKFDPTKSNMPRFNTYFCQWARRVNQVRTYADYPPGTIKIDGKFVVPSSLSVDEDHGSDMRHPEVYDKDFVLQNAVQTAMAGLSETQREFAQLRWIEKAPVRVLTERLGLSKHMLRKLEVSVAEKLQYVLRDFA